MQKINVAINGFGRIGRITLRAYLENPKFNIVAINNPGDAEQLTQLYNYDTNYGPAHYKATLDGTDLIINQHRIRFCHERDPELLPWKELEVDIVLECTGVFKDQEGCKKHIKAGCKKVIISAPGKDEDLTVVMGINQDQYDTDKHNIISNGSCTTNCFAPILKIMDENFGLEKCMMTTVHSYTNSQNIQDSTHRKDSRRARAAASNIIPTSTGAVKAIKKIMPELADKVMAQAMRVPTPTVSIIDAKIITSKNTSKEEILEVFKQASENQYKGIIDISHEPLVSSDYIQNPYSSIIDAEYLKVLDSNMVQILSWYDNEYGYCCRLLDLAEHVAKQL